MRNLVLLLTFSLALASCGESTKWVKPGATVADLEAATVACNNEIATSRIGARAAAGMASPSAGGRAMSSSAARAEADQAREECLQAKGWTREQTQ